MLKIKGFNMDNKATVDVGEDDLGAVFNFAIRYCIGRYTYAPGIAFDVITPMIPYLNDRTLIVMARDIREADERKKLGDEVVDRPPWIKFVAQIEDELGKRGKEVY